MSMDFVDLNMNTELFSWIISMDRSVPLDFHGYEYEYEKFSRILSMESPRSGGLDPLRSC
jgi:hypothetical protein